jgi:CarD family transcriptional regulator
MEEEKMFEVGDAIIHPVRGAGVVERVEERPWRGSSDLYYRIKLLDQPGTKLMVPTSAAETIGLRRAIPESKLSKVWQVLHADPKNLPSNHKKRYKLLDNKLHTGNVFEVAEVVRDMAWRQQQEGNLTTMGKRRYGEGMRILAGEIAAVKGIELEEAEAQIRAKIQESISPVPAA